MSTPVLCCTRYCSTISLKLQAAVRNKYYIDGNVFLGSTWSFWWRWSSRERWSQGKCNVCFVAWISLFCNKINNVVQIRCRFVARRLCHVTTILIYCHCCKLFSFHCAFLIAYFCLFVRVNLVIGGQLESLVIKVLKEILDLQDCLEGLGSKAFVYVCYKISTLTHNTVFIYCMWRQVTQLLLTRNSSCIPAEVRLFFNKTCFTTGQ